MLKLLRRLRLRGRCYHGHLLTGLETVLLVSNTTSAIVGCLGGSDSLAALRSPALVVLLMLPFERLLLQCCNALTSTTATYSILVIELVGLCNLTVWNVVALVLRLLLLLLQMGR